MSLADVDTPSGVMESTRISSQDMHNSRLSQSTDISNVTHSDKTRETDRDSVQEQSIFSHTSTGVQVLVFYVFFVFPLFQIFCHTSTGVQVLVFYVFFVFPIFVSLVQGFQSLFSRFSLFSPLFNHDRYTSSGTGFNTD